MAQRKATSVPVDLLRRGGGLVAAVLMVVMTLFAFSPTSPAAAAEGSQVTIDSIDIQDNSDSIEDWRYQRVDVTWSIPAAAKPPVSLSIDLPENFPGKAETFPVMGPDDQVAGRCVVTTTDITCTINDDFIVANPHGVRGDFFFEARTELDNRENRIEAITIGRFSEEVVVTPSRNWCTQNCEFGGVGAGKWGSYDTATDTIVWTVRVPAGDNGIAAGQKITVTDELDTDAYELVVDAQYPRVREAGLLQYSRWGSEGIAGWQTRTDGVRWSDDHLTVSFDSRAGRGSAWSNDIEPPAKGAQRGTDGSFYEVQWRVKALTGGELQANGDRIFRNAARWAIGGDLLSTTNGSVTRYNRGGNVVGTNYGKFQVTKELTGDTTLNPAFTVRYTVTEGATVREESFTVRSGETFTSPELFRGSVVTLTEVKPTDPANVTWTDPAFLDAEGNPADTITFTADGNGKLGEVTPIRLVNRATLQKATFSAHKSVVNEGGVPLADDLTFAVHYSYPADAARGFPAGSGTLTLPLNGDVVTSPELPVGARVTLTEPDLPNVPGATWGEPVIEPSTLTIGEAAEPVTVAVTNTITQDVGGFSVTKSISGPGAELVPEDAVFTVSYAYDAINGFPAGSGQVELAAGETATVNGLPAGATVTLTEVTVDDPTGGTWGEPVFSESSFTIVKDTVVSVDLDNPIAWNNGDFSVRKQLTGDGADLVSEDALFTVEYSYVLPEELGAEPASGTGTLTVGADGRAVVSDPLPYGTEVTLSEAAPAAVAGGTWLGHEFDHPSFTVGDETTLEVVLTNAIERDLGGFSVTKTVTGSGAELIGADEKFTVNYSYPAGEWYEAGEGTLTVTNAGTTAVDGIPAGAVVTLEEVLPADPDNGTWVSATFPSGNVVAIGKNEVAEVALVNEVALGEGGLRIRKVIDGSGAELVADGSVFAVHYEYDAGAGFEAGEGTVEVTADGTPVTVANLPAGAEIRLSEDTPAAVDGGTWTGHAFSADTVVIGKAEVADVTLTNTIEEDPVDGSDPGNGGGRGNGGAAEAGTGGSGGANLATTGGGGVGALLWIALILVAAGTAATLTVRRRQH